MSKPLRYEKLTHEQLQGADYALRILRTSPVIRGQALEVLDGQIAEVRDEMSKDRAAPKQGDAEQRIRDAIAELESALDTGYMYETDEHVRRAIALLRRG